MPTLIQKPPIDVQLTTVERVEAILREASVPVSRGFIHHALEARKAGTTSARLNRALDYFFKRGMAVEGGKGIQWTFSQSASLKRARAIGRRV